VVEIDEFAVSRCYIIGLFVNFRHKVGIIVLYDTVLLWISADTNEDDLE